PEELPLLKDIEKLIGKRISVVEDHPFKSLSGVKAHIAQNEALTAKPKERRSYAGSKTSGDYWRRQKRTR
ncbi:MAG: ATP-dependent helicase, partial [Rikenellaceae bacterium]